MAHTEADVALEIFKNVHTSVDETMFKKIAELKKRLTEIEHYYGGKAREYSQAFHLIQNRIRTAEQNTGNHYFDAYVYVMKQLDNSLATEINRGCYKHNVLALCHPRRNEGETICEAYSHNCKMRQLCAVCLSFLPTTYYVFFCCKTFVCAECTNICVAQQLTVPKTNAVCVACYAVGENGPFKRPTDAQFNYTFPMLERVYRR